MKKYIIGVFVLVFLCSCDPIEWTSGYNAWWFIKNSTDKSIVVYHSRPSHIRDSICNPGDSIIILRSGRALGYHEFPQFEDILMLDYIYLYDTDGNLLKEWYQEPRPVVERNIFEEKFWNHFVTQDRYSTFIWTYDLTNDILITDDMLIND